MLLSWMRKRVGVAPAISRVKANARWRPSLEELEERCVLAAPVITSIAGSSLPISALNLPISKSLIVPITATGSFPLSYNVTSDNADVIVATHTGNTFLELDVTGPTSASTGTMIFEMLGDVAPNTVATIDGLVQAGFYNGLTFHRIVQNFVIQGGDPAGNGSGGPGFQFDDEFNINAIFSGNGQLAMANSGPDTNGSQFFVTVGTQRSLDYTYTIFGQLLSGFSVLTAINNLPTVNSKPTGTVTITSAKLITDTTDSVVTLEADGSFTGSAHITVAVDDGHGGTTQQVFTVNAFNDATQPTPIVDPPFLQDPIPDVVTPINTTAVIPVSVINVDNQTLSFSGAIDTTKASGTIDTPIGNSTNYRITPNLGVTGPLPLTVDIYKGYSIGGVQQFDSQTIIIGVGTQALSGSATPVTATALTQVSSVTVATFTDPNAGDTVSNFLSVQINWGDDHLSTGTLTKSGNTFTVTGTNTYTNPGSYPVSVNIENSLGATLHLKSTATVSAFAGPVTLDVDGSGGQGVALTDGILILRYLFNFSGTTLTSGALGAGATRTVPSAITSYLNFARTGPNSMLDADGNGTADPLTDGILILRYLFGFTGSALTSGALGFGATRTDPTAIKNFLDGFNPGHLFADTVASGPPVGETLTDQDLQAITQAAVARWEATDLSSAARAALESAHVQIGNLGGTGLGETFGNQVYIDPNAAGYGWFVDPTPTDDAEFATSTGTELHAAAGTTLAKEMDLLTVVMHELGLVMGLKEYNPSVLPNTLMTDVLSPGVRRLP